MNTTSACKSTSEGKMMTGAEALVQSLVREGVDVVFAYPDEDNTLNNFILYGEKDKIPL